VATAFDIVIRNGTVVDGTGAAPFAADIAIRQGAIVAVGIVDGQGTEEIDARGQLVTPGFVDVHTHYDGQATWSNRLSPSSRHGVTTAVMGNCGVGFAPCRPQDHDRLIELMEGVEDIPGVVMREGLPWAWESFPEYLDFLEQRHFDMDVAAYLPHAPLRVYVMGERAARREDATDADIEQMQAIAREAIEAGALGFATSRSINHKSINGELIATYGAAERELQGIMGALKEADAGVLQLLSDFDEPEQEFQMLNRLMETSGRPMTFSLLQLPDSPDRWRGVLADAEKAAAAGKSVTPQVCGRPVGVLAGLELSTNPFTFCPGYKDIADLPLAQRLERMRDPALRARIVAEYPTLSWEPISRPMAAPHVMYPLTEDVDYEPRSDCNMEALARQAGVPVGEYLYDYILQDDGKAIIYIPFANFCDGTLSAVEGMLRSDITIPGLGDGGAHCGAICDASLPTYLLMRWTGETEGPLSLPQMIRSLTLDSARTVGLHDRGRIAVGFKADVNVIDIDNLRLKRPHIVYDLPKGRGRLDQEAEGYTATIVSGTIASRRGVATSALPGRLVRGAQDDPTAGRATAQATLA
jgi:N-acyl-D-aspartate/D-glutamate deacylase